jgi:hypothetical protein
MKAIGPIFAIVPLVLLYGLAASADWHDIKPQVTTERELTSAFGTADEVVTTFPWSEWNAKWKIRPRVSGYTLRYNSASTSAILVGPAGKADSAEVDVWDSKIIAVTWHYGGPSAKTAAATLRADPQISFIAGGSVSAGGGGPIGQSIYAELGPNDTKVTVSLSLK